MKTIVQGYPAYCYASNGSAAAITPPALANQSVVLLIHGAAMDHSVWQWQARHLAQQGHVVVAPDLPAHGQSPGSLRESIGAMADWIAALLDSLSLQHAHIVGHSMGSLVALDLALRHTNRVNRLALIGCAVPMAVGELFLAEAKAHTLDGALMEALWGHAPAVRLGASPAPGTYLPQASLQLIRRAEPFAQHTDLSACGAYAPPSEQIKTMTRPTLVMVGSRDQMTPAKQGQALAALLPNAQLVKVAAGHSMMSEAPQAVNAHLRQFFAGGPAASLTSLRPPPALQL